MRQVAGTREGTCFLAVAVPIVVVSAINSAVILMNTEDIDMHLLHTIFQLKLTSFFPPSSHCSIGSQAPYYCSASSFQL